MKVNNSQIVPKQKTFKTPVNKIVLTVLGRSLEVLSKYDEEIKQEISFMPTGFTFGMKILPHHGSMLMTKTSTGSLKYLNEKEGDENKCNLLFCLRNPTSAFLMFTAQMATHTAYAQHRMSAKGDLSYAMIITRCLNRLQAYLFPHFIAKKILKKVPSIPLSSLIKMRLRLYLLGVPFGIS